MITRRPRFICRSGRSSVRPPCRARTETDSMCRTRICRLNPQPATEHRAEPLTRQKQCGIRHGFLNFILFNIIGAGMAAAPQLGLTLISMDESRPIILHIMQ
ncbi:hypothetical protein BaRGS_00004029 [Batillaria attramentaria]|uniref:Uncharacterized protein n=1 Tax=Batillaria attramentaria TaxID=370345 RepID=A0ABD0LZU5_9CAEN